MTIRSIIDPRALNRRLNLLERCAEKAPPETYEEARELRDLIAETMDTFMAGALRLGLKAPGDDTAREVEAVLYGYIREANPIMSAVIEGFGEHVDGPAGARVIAGAARDRLALAALGRK